MEIFVSLYFQYHLEINHEHFRPHRQTDQQMNQTCTLAVSKGLGWIFFFLVLVVLLNLFCLLFFFCSHLIMNFDALFHISFLDAMVTAIPFRQ